MPLPNSSLPALPADRLQSAIEEALPDLLPLTAEQEKRIADLARGETQELAHFAEHQRLALYLWLGSQRVPADRLTLVGEVVF